MGTEWTNIQTGINRDEDELEVVVAGEEETEDDKAENKAQVEEEAAEKEEASEEKTVEDTEKPKPSRAKERIRQLAKEKNEALAAAQKERADADVLRRQLAELQKSSLDSSVKQYDSLIETKTAALRQAKSDGDLDVEMKLDAELDEIRLNRRIAAAQKEKVQVPEVKAKPQVAAAPQIPEKMAEWLDNNDWFHTDRRLQAFTAAVADDLLAKGFSEDDDEFYKAVDKELAKTFPTRFGVKGSDKVSSKEEEDESSSDEDDVKETSKSRPRQTVAGASRTPIVKKDRVVLSPEEAEFADRNGIPRERMALRKKQYESSQKDGAWTTVSTRK